MFRITALVAFCLMAPGVVFGQEAPPPENPHVRRASPYYLDDSIEARVARAVSGHLNRCWRSTADLGPNISVTLALTLNEDGSFSGAPRVLYPRGWLTRTQREAVRRAVEAVNRCEPLPLANDAEFAANYEVWREQEVTFAARRPQH
jgi:hypothetical protein